MTISSAQVRALCTRSEVELVRASRKPELSQQSRAALNRLAARARKRLTKWQHLGRGQARLRGRQTGAGETDENTRRKTQIFRDALKSIELRLAELDASAPPAAKHAKPTTKRDRSAGHRATRSAVRKGMTAVEDSLNRRTKKKAR